MSHPSAQRHLWVESDDQGCLQYRADATDSDRPTSPLEYLALALGGCLLFFARRFFTRRGIESDPAIRVCWEVDTRGLDITAMTVTLTPPAPLSEADSTILRRMLDQCPVHRALAAIPIDVYIEKTNTDEERAPDDS